MAHKESKLKRAELRKMFQQQKCDQEVKDNNPNATKWFKEEPYQLQYQRKYGGSK